MLDSYCTSENVALFKIGMALRSTQCALPLKPHVGWGGARRGAGRKPSSRRPVPHRRREGIVARVPGHVTVKIRPGVPSLRTVPLVRALERSFAHIRARSDFRLVHYSLQTTHAHLLVEATDADALARGLMAIGARIARAVNRMFARTGPVLAERFHVRSLQTPREVRNALAYVLLNARRHATRLRGRAIVDPASSGRWFDGWRSTPVSEFRSAFVPVARARAWLLAKGWRRHGLIDPAEVPG
jgi:hypothetical protein